MAAFRTEVQAVVTREQAFPGGLRRKLTYWLCWDSLLSGAGTFHIKCHCIDQQAGRLLREKVVLSGDLGSDRKQATLVFTLLTNVEIPISPERLQDVTGDLMRREVTMKRYADYQQMSLVARSSALSMLAKLNENAI